MPGQKRWKGENTSLIQYGNGGRSRYNGRNRRNRASHSQNRFRHTDNDQCSTSSSSTSNSVETARDSDELEIPGFYYDKEKKRYFKIAPNHASSTCNYTRDAIAQNAAEMKRQKDVKEILGHERTTSTPVKCSHRLFDNLTSLVITRTTHGYNKQFLKQKLFQRCVTNLKPSDSQYLFTYVHSNSLENLEHMHVMHIGSDHDEILALWSIQDSWVQRIQRLRITEAPRTHKQCSLSVVAEPCLNAVTPMLKKVTDLCWAHVAGKKKCVLYTTMCHIGRQESLACLKSLDPEEAAFGNDFDLGKKATWSCAWNRIKCQFGVGSEKCALVLDVERRTLWEYNTNKSDPLSLVFSKHTGNKLHTGTRKGQIITFDMRSRSTYPVSCLNHNSCVCSIQELENDNHLLAADFTGKVNLWDLRKKSVIVQYKGNVNQYSRLPVHVDETQKIVYTVGEDGYTRFWTLDQGRLLYTIPPPCSVSRETIPCVQLSSRWGNRDGNIGLIMGLKNKLYYYGTLPVTLKTIFQP